MSALVEGARRALGRQGPSVGDRLQALEAAAWAARGRLDDTLVDRAEEVVRRGSGRLALSGDHTVVALAGATGSGKSTMLNALAGVELATTGVRRPTTSATAAVVFGDAVPEELLDWLDVRVRHHVTGRPELDGLVLLDLPDHDSTEVAHHLEVDRLVALVDVMVWVLDPQKYADAAVHERYLRPLAGHRDVMIVVLNHVDDVPVDDRERLLADLSGRLVEDGLTGVPVVATSARHGDGIPQLTALVAERVRAKKAVAARLAADVAAAGHALNAAQGRPGRVEVDGAARDDLVEALAAAAGVPTVVAAVRRSMLRRGTERTGWPFTAWLARLRPDPLRRLHLGLGAAGSELTAISRSSVPEPTRVQRARVDGAVRRVADSAGAGLSPPWQDAVRRASVSRVDELDDALDRAVGGTDLGLDRTPLWWPVARLLQLLLAAAVVVGVVWLGVLAVLGYLQMPQPETPTRYGLPLPTLLLALGVAGGVALGVVSRVVNGAVARGRARRAARRFGEAIGEVADELVLAPVDDELQACADVRRALDLALRSLPAASL